MHFDAIISELEEQWDFEAGFFGHLRRGEYDGACFERLAAILAGIDLQGEATVNRRLVSLLWYMPLFMEWQKDRVHEAGGDLAAFEESTNEIQRLIERILGVP